MKRKSLALLMAAAMVMGLTGCQVTVGGGDSAEKPAEAPAETEQEAEAPAETEQEAEVPAAGGDGFYAGKTVEMIVPWGAGGGADTACRLICSYMEKELGCTIVINNVTGGGGSIGLAQLTEAPADGMTYAYFANTDSNGDIMLEGEQEAEAPAETEQEAEVPAAGGDGFYAGKTVEMIVPWGAGGSIGLAQLTEAPADGMTYAYFANTDSNGDIMLEGVPYKAEDFAPVCKFAADPHIILASNASGITDLEGLKAAGDGKTLWGIGGAWTHWDFLKLEFEEATGTSYKRLVYDGGAAVITDVMSGDCTIATPFVSESLPAIEAGEAVPIAITSAERNPACPDIPTLAELGLEGFESTMWRGFVAPAGAPEDAMREFADAVAVVCENPEFQEKAVQAGVTVDFTGYDEFQDFYWENHESVKAYYEANAGM